jgi:hypothetical protein
VIGVEAFRHRTRKRRLSKLRFIKHNTERLRLRADPAHQCNERARVHAARKKYAERHIAHEMKPN